MPSSRQTLPLQGNLEAISGRVANVAGGSLPAGLAAEVQEGRKLERLCRYIDRAAVSEQRLSLTAMGLVRYQLKGPHRDGTTHVVPLDFIARLAALIPRSWMNLIRYHNLFPHRVLIRIAADQEL